MQGPKEVVCTNPEARACAAYLVGAVSPSFVFDGNAKGLRRYPR